MRKKERFYPKGEELSSQGEGDAFREETSFRAEAEKLSCAGRKNFCAHKNKFPCGRKYFFVRTEIYLLPQENLPNLAERSNALFNNKLIYHDQDQSC